ncbi:hypothetical protein GE300_11975 [Rhodobacteraceae bacterium 2CG4]|uniref:Uncharacterized protein n=1 Tax=Halovulum marinum TaxID=2662447 RepID=A0A6L5Z1F3_9RHOB|nr:hypothetical protein [Halovulum marinum]MSU90328.1 hypothetical protein [Halovulum marinum]
MKSRRKHPTITQRDFRSDMKGFVPSCFHNASAGGGNTNAAPEGGAQAFNDAVEFGYWGSQPPLSNGVEVQVHALKKKSLQASVA